MWKMQSGEKRCFLLFEAAGKTTLVVGDIGTTKKKLQTLHYNDRKGTLRARLHPTKALR